MLKDTWAHRKGCDHVVRQYIKMLYAATTND